MTEESRVAQLASQALKLHLAGSYAEADRLYAQALKLEPTNSAVLLAAGRLHVDCGNFASGLDTLLAAQEAGAEGPEVSLAIGVAANALQRFDLSTPALRKCIEVCPDWTDVWTQLAFALCAQEQFLEATLLFREVFSEKPTPEAVFNWASALHTAGQFQEAAEKYAIAIRSQPENAQMYFGLADALTALNRTEEAIAAYRAGLKRDPSDREARKELARLLAETEPAPQGVSAPQRASKPAKRKGKGGGRR